MPKKIRLKGHLSTEELQRCYRGARDPVLRSHYRIVWLLSEGRTTREVMEATGCSRSWVQQMAKRYNARGAGGLGDRRYRNPGGADWALLSADQREELARALERSPEDGGMWNPRKVAAWIEQKRVDTG